MEKKMTWQEIADIINNMSDEEKRQNAQVIEHSPIYEKVHEGRPVVIFEKVKNIVRYYRSSNDNCYHPDDFVLYIDFCPFAENGATGHEMDIETFSINKDIFPQNHSPESDWTGPAQEIFNKKYPE